MISKTIIIFICTSAAVAAGNPRALPYSYTPATLPGGGLELEQFIDLTPVRVAREGDAGTDAVTSLRSELTTEIEIGITDRLEAGLYLAFAQSAAPGTPALQFRGLRQRLRYRFSDWLGIYGEIAEYHDEIELEEKVLLARRSGAVTAAANLWVEQEYYFQDQQWKLVYNPTAGVTYELSPRAVLGVEYWARGRFDDGDAGEGTRHYAGPTAMFQRGEAWLSVGAYARLDALARDARVGDAFGRLWVRLVLGIGL